MNEDPEQKYILFMSGSAPQLWVNDPAMFDEIQRMVPFIIDRWSIDNRSFTAKGGQAMSFMRSTTQQQERRRAMAKAIGINYASRFLQMMQIKIKSHLDQWPKNEWISLDELMT